MTNRSTPAVPSGTRSENSAPRSQRINLRATTDELTVLRRAAALHGITLTAFILTSAVREAEALLGDNPSTSATTTSSRELS
jgi:uncharacterized protein (DUF1778 family)